MAWKHFGHDVKGYGLGKKITLIKRARRRRGTTRVRTVLSFKRPLEGLYKANHTM
jgi:hypothetical protein